MLLVSEMLLGLPFCVGLSFCCRISTKNYFDSIRMLDISETVTDNIIAGVSITWGSTWLSDMNPYLNGSTNISRYGFVDFSTLVDSVFAIYQSIYVCAIFDLRIFEFKVCLDSY